MSRQTVDPAGGSVTLPALVALPPLLTICRAVLLAYTPYLMS